MLDTLHRHLVKSGAPRRLWTGAWCVAQGVLMTLRSPALLRLAFVPVVINLALYPLAGWLAWQGIAPMHSILFPWQTPDGFWALPVTLFSWAMWIVVALVLGLTALVAVSAVGNAVGSPFLDVLSQRAEALISRRTVPMGPGVMESIWRTSRMQAAILLVYVPCLCINIVVSMVPVVGTVMGPLLQAGITVLFLCLQVMDWPAERRRMGLRARLRLVLDNKVACLGFGAACWFLLLAPFTLPFAAAGGTLLFVGLCPPEEEAASR